MFPRIFLFTAQFILLVTGLAKVLSATGKQGVLFLNEPVFGLPYHTLFAGVGYLELSLVLLMWFLRKKPYVFFMPGWLGLNFVAYRTLYGLAHPSQPCPCLGTFAMKLHMNDTTANCIFWIVALYFILGSAKIFFQNYRFPSLNQAVATEE